MAGVEGEDAMIGCEEKKSFVAGSCIMSEKGVVGVSGDRSTAEELPVLKKLLSILLKSLSEIESADEFEAVSAEVLRISGAANA